MTTPGVGARLKNWTGFSTGYAMALPASNRVQSVGTSIFDNNAQEPTVRDDSSWILYCHATTEMLGRTSMRMVIIMRYKYSNAPRFVQYKMSKIYPTRAT